MTALANTTSVEEHRSQRTRTPNTHSENTTEPLPPHVIVRQMAIQRELDRAVGAAAGDEGHILSQTRQLAFELANFFASCAGQIPLIGAGLDDEIVLEWWTGKRKLTMYVHELGAEYIKVWGSDVEREMADGSLDSAGTLHSLSAWIRGK